MMFLLSNDNALRTEYSQTKRPKGPYDDKQVLTICISYLWWALKVLTMEFKQKRKLFVYSYKMLNPLKYSYSYNT